MKLVALLAIVAAVLLEAVGAIPNASVGGAMTRFFIYIIAMLAFGLAEAFENGRGVLGWIVSPVVAVVGGMVALMLAVAPMEMIMPLLNLNGSLADTGGPLLYIFSAVMMGIGLLGAWLGLWIANRFRKKPA